MPRIAKYFIIIFVLVAIVFLFRRGEIAPAGLLSFILFAAALAEKIMRINYMRKMYGQGSANAPSDGQMTRKEALEILELDEKASDDDIKKAYKRLIAKIHPDQGGSKYLAAKINLARDVLLKKK